MSCTCQRCGKQYKVDVNIPDHLWKIIRPKYHPDPESGLLCGQCIMVKIEDLDKYGAFELIEII